MAPLTPTITHTLPSTQRHATITEIPTGLTPNPVLRCQVFEQMAEVAGATMREGGYPVAKPSAMAMRAAAEAVDEMLAATSDHGGQVSLALLVELIAERLEGDLKHRSPPVG